MSKEKFKYIYGPVESWGIGKSLGIDPLSDSRKICNMNCIYCQLGKTDQLTDQRKNYVPAHMIADEIERFYSVAAQDDPKIIRNIQYLTFSGRGEPTLAANLGEMARLLRKIREEKIAVITNSTFLHLPSVQKDLMEADLVVAKLDAYDQASLQNVDKIMPGVQFEGILQGIKDFRKAYRGRLVVRVMFVEENYSLANRFIEIIKDLGADDIHLNTPLRPSAARPLTVDEMMKIKLYFEGMPVTTVFDHERKPTIPFDDCQTIKRHGNYTKTF